MYLKVEVFALSCVYTSMNLKMQAWIKLTHPNMLQSEMLFQKLPFSNEDAVSFETDNKNMTSQHGNSDVNMDLFLNTNGAWTSFVFMSWRKEMF